MLAFAFLLIGLAVAVLVMPVSKWGWKRLEVVQADHPHDTGAQVESSGSRVFSRDRLIGFGAGLLLGLVLVGPRIFEPKGPVRCEAVQIIGIERDGRGRAFIAVATLQDGTSHSWRPGAYSGPFPKTYRGPAVLVLRRGAWTGKDHLKVSETCPRT
jgi:hypothetical protein